MGFVDYMLEKHPSQSFHPEGGGEWGSRVNKLDLQLKEYTSGSKRNEREFVNFYFGARLSFCFFPDFRTLRTTINCVYILFIKWVIFLKDQLSGVGLYQRVSCFSKISSTFFYCVFFVCIFLHFVSDFLALLNTYLKTSPPYARKFVTVLGSDTSLLSAN